MSEPTPEPAGLARVGGEDLEGFVRQRIQGFSQELLDEEVTALLGRRRYQRRTGVDAAPVAAPAAVEAPQAAAPAAGDVERGRAVAQANGCVACHSQDGSTGVGPTWQGLFGSQEKLADGGSVTVDDAYLRESILVLQRRLLPSRLGAPMVALGRGAPDRLPSTAAAPRMRAQRHDRAGSQGPPACAAGFPRSLPSLLLSD